MRSRNWWSEVGVSRSTTCMCCRSRVCVLFVPGWINSCACNEKKMIWGWPWPPGLINIGKPNNFLSLIWNGLGLRTLPIRAFSHVVEWRCSFCASKQVTGARGSQHRLLWCQAVLQPYTRQPRGKNTPKSKKEYARVAAEACLWHTYHRGLQHLLHPNNVLKG